MPRTTTSWVMVVACLSIGAAVACRGGNSPTATPTATVATATPTATSTPSPEAAVLNAYTRYWQVYSQAIFDLDESHLIEVMTGPRLDRAHDEIRALMAKGQAVKIVVTNQPQIASIQGDTAVLIDMYQNGSYVIDAGTKQPITGAGTPNVLKDAVTLQRVDGTWKVRDTVRQAPNQ